MLHEGSRRAATGSWRVALGSFLRSPYDGGQFVCFGGSVIKMKWIVGTALIIALSLFPHTPASAQNQHPGPTASFPWMNKSLSPDQRAEMVLKQLTLDEKINLMHGQASPQLKPVPVIDLRLLTNGGAGFTYGVPRLGIPSIQMSDAAYGVARTAQNGRYSTALPSNLGATSSWDPHAACEYGALIGRELRDQGFNMSLGGGVNLAREPRDGRTFEFQGEDPLLAGTMVGNRIKCEREQHVIADIKHYAVNDQESGRTLVNSVIDRRVLRETDLLAFEIGVEIGKPGAVMCSYNGVNGTYACQNKYLLTTVLKDDWHFPGFVVSDWGGTHSTIEASAAGLDNEEPTGRFFGAPLKQAVEDGKVPISQINEHVLRILRTEFADGLVDDPPVKGVIPVERDLEISQKLADESIVLLKDHDNVLPLDPAKVRSIAVIGEHADTGMISGGGSAQVDPPGSTAKSIHWQKHLWFPTSPLKAIRAYDPSAEVKFDSGENPAEAAALAKQSDVALVFVHQWTSEGMDLPNLSLPGNQDALIEQVASANPKTIVVLETGTVVVMPWLDKVDGVVEAWYAGSRGADAVADVLFGKVNPSAKLPITFPRSVADLPHPEIVKPPAEDVKLEREGHEFTKPVFDVHYDAGLKVGYKWYDAEHKPVLFPFGFGLSYTTYSYSGLKVEPGSGATVTFTVRNTGSRAGDEIAEVYAALPPSAGEPPKRLVGWARVHLDPGQSKEVSVAVSQRILSIYDVNQNGWKLVPGQYVFMAGGSSQDLPLKQDVNLQ